MYALPTSKVCGFKAYYHGINSNAQSILTALSRILLLFYWWLLATYVPFVALTILITFLISFGTNLIKGMFPILINTLIATNSSF